MLALVSSAWKLDAEFDRTAPVIASKLEDKYRPGFGDKRRAVAVFRLRARASTAERRALEPRKGHCGWHQDEKGNSCEPVAHCRERD